MSLEEVTRNYLQAFQNRDIETLSEFFSESVELRDWDLYAEGKKNVIEANKGIFDAFSIITVEITNIITKENSVVVEFILNLSDEGSEVSILVTDIIEFDERCQISRLRAYRGN